MNFKIVINFIFLIFIIFSCTKKTSKYELLWTSKNENAGTIYPIQYKDIFISTYKKDAEHVGIKAFYIKNGKAVWNLEEPVSTSKTFYYNLKAYQKDNILVLPCDNELIAIDLKKRQTLWHTTLYDSAENFIEGTGNQVFRTYYDNQKKEYIIVKIDLFTGNSSIILQDAITQNNKLFCRTPVPIPYEGDTLLFFSAIQQHLTTRKTIPTISVFSMAKKEIIKKDTLKINDMGYGVTKQPIYDKNNMIFINDNQMIVYDWKNKYIKSILDLPRDMLTSRPLIDQNICYYPAEDGFLYAVELEKNNILWKAKISGTPSQLKMNKDKLFIVGGGDGVFYCINKKDGSIDFSVPNEKEKYSFERPLLLTKDNRILLCSKEQFYYFEF